MIKTSFTDPIRVDILPGATFAPGRLGLTFAPGKTDPNAAAGPWQRDLELDLTRLREHYRADVLVTLLEQGQFVVDEFALLAIEDLFDRVAAHGIEALWFPIADGCAPTSVDEVRKLVATLSTHTDAGQTVVVHCRGGLGRAGTVAACCLVARGLEPGEAIEAVRHARSPAAIETRAQERFIRDFGAALPSTR